MPDSNRDIASLIEQNTLLKNALKRERNAKKKLENKLEEKIQDNFENNHAFLEAYQQSNHREIQLQFLANLTNGMLEGENIDDMACLFIGNISNIIEQFSAYEFTITHGKTKAVTKISDDFKTLEPVTWNDDFSSINQLLKPALLDERWHRFELQNHPDLKALNTIFQHGTLLLFHIVLSKSQARAFVLDIHHYCYSNEFKQTLNIATQQFSLALKRRLAEVELVNNFQKLKLTLKELKSTQHQLNHSEKMASLGQLAAGVAHEINNPLGYIASNLAVLDDYLSIYKKAFNYIDNKAIESFTALDDLQYAKNDTQGLIDSCINGVQRIHEIVSSLKTFSRKDNGEHLPTDINAVIENALAIVWNKLKYNYQVSKKLTKNLPLIKANGGQLQQVFINLFINAVQAMKDQGKLIICSQLIDDYVEITVSDTGCGMDEKSIKRLFEPFYTTKAENEGTGLGLSVSYAILEKHNASINVSSSPNKGSKFTLRFPVY